MKKLFVFLFLLFFAVTVFAQERTLSTYNLPEALTYYKYTGVAADTLMYGTQDTIDIPIFVNKEYPVQYYAKFNVDTIGDNDFKLKVAVLGKVFEDESWSAIATDSTAVTDNGTDVVVYSTSNPSYVFANDSTITQTYNAHYYRYLLFRLILSDTSTPGDGFTLNNMELKIWERKY